MLLLSGSANDQYLWSAILLVRAEPGSGGCLDALDLEGTSRTRIAPTPRPPVESGLLRSGLPIMEARQDRCNAVLIRCLD
jgi:hypothetical protein